MCACGEGRSSVPAKEHIVFICVGSVRREFGVRKIVVALAGGPAGINSPASLPTCNVTQSAPIAASAFRRPAKPTLPPAVVFLRRASWPPFVLSQTRALRFGGRVRATRLIPSRDLPASLVRRPNSGLRRCDVRGRLAPRLRRQAPYADSAFSPARRRWFPARGTDRRGSSAIPRRRFRPGLVR